MKAAFFFLSSILFVLSPVAHAQYSLAGLWQVEKVTVGDKEMTPVAKWFHIKDDSTIIAGNGGIQNSVALWRYSEPNSAIYINDPTMYDPAGPFTVKMMKDKMSWSRLEDGALIIVTLKPVDKIPQAPWDKIVGLWLLEKATKAGKDVTKQYDPQDKRWIFMRWDRVFTDTGGPEGKQTGIWHFNGHHPILTLIHDKGDAYDTAWSVTIQDNQMKWKSTGKTADQNVELSFIRTDRFPE